LRLQSVKKNYITLLMCFITLNSYSQEIKEKVETELPCYNTEEILKILKERYKEMPFMIGKASDSANSVVSIWINPVDSTWTIIATKKDITCVVGMGTDMRVVPYKKRT
jgi:hypothetical protein